MTGRWSTRKQLLLWLSGTLLLALVAYAAPTITSVAGSTFGGNTPFGGNVPAITSGSPQSSFTLVISGSFDPQAFQSVTWLNTVTNQTQTFDQESGVFSVSSTTIYVSIPRVLYATPVSSPQQVQITVDEFVFTGALQLRPRITSSPGSFTINPPLTSLGPALPVATRGAPYNAPYVTGGTGPYFVGTLPTMPANLTIAGATAQNVTGTCNVLGFFTFQPTITDAWGNTLSPPEGLQCVTAATLTSLNPNSAVAATSGFGVLATGSNFAVPGTVASVGVPGSRVLWFPPGTGPANSSNAGISLPALVSSANQLTFSLPANLIQNAGTATVYVIQPDGQLSNGLPFTIRPAGPPPVQITTASVPPGVVGTPYAAGFSAIGGVGNYSFSLSGGSLPGGLTLTADGGLSGTPSATGQFRFSVKATDAAGQSDIHDYVLVIAPPALTVTGEVSDVPVGSPMSVRFGGSGGTPPYTFAVSGSIPSGTTFSAGTLSGTPVSQGTFGFTVAVTDSLRVVATRSFTIRVTAPSLAVTGTLGNGLVGSPYAGQVGGIGGAPPYTFSATGLPAGVSLSGSGAASGTPSADGTYAVVVTVTDSTGAKASQTFPVVIEVPPLTVTTSSLPNGTVGAAYSASLSATGGVPPYSWSVTGLPGGIAAGPDGALSGTPTAPGTSSVSVRVTDSKGAGAGRTLTLVVDVPALSIATSVLPAGIVGTAYSASVSAAGGIPPYTFSASGLPAGLSMAGGGAISGTPTAMGTSNVSVTVRDSLGTSASRGLSLTVALPVIPGISFTGLTDSSNPGTQPRVTVGLGSPYPVNVTVVLTLTFTPDSGADDPTVQFSTGGRTAQVVIPAGTTTAPTDLGFQTGTVAGTITITARLSAATQDVTPTPIPTRTIRITATAPVLQSVTATRNSTGFTVAITGFSSSRELQQAVFTFTAAAGTNLQASTVTIPVDALFSQYYQSTASAPFGSQFTLTQPFTVQGGTTGIVSVSVTLSNRVGTSAAVSANLQ